MNRRLKHFWRYTKWPLFFILLIVAFWLWFVPFAKWLFVGKTLELYQEVAEQYSTDKNEALDYHGVITDTLLRPSVKEKGKQDTFWISGNNQSGMEL